MKKNIHLKEKDFNYLLLCLSSLILRLVRWIAFEIGESGYSYNKWTMFWI